MAEIVATFLLEKLTTQLDEEVGLLRTVRPDVQYITEELDRIKSFLRVADAREDTDPRLKVWVKQVREVANDIEDSLDEFDLHLAHKNTYNNDVSSSIRKLFRFVKNLKARHRIALDVKEAISRLQHIAEAKRWYDDGRLLPSRSGGGGGSSRWKIDSRGDALLVEEADLVGIREKKKTMIDWLMKNDSGRQLVCVVGMGGLGKTTLVKKVYEDSKVKKRFKVHAWVTVSRSEKTKDLLRGLLRQIYRVIGKPVPTEVNDIDSNELRERIKNLLKESRYLIVLDDVWGAKAWDSINLALPKSEKFGSKVVITTRNAEIAHKACAEARDWVYELQPLREEESWELFLRKAFSKDWGGTCPAHLKDACSRVLKRCGGLPLAIVAIGAVLGTKDERDSAEELEALSRSIGTEIEENWSPIESMKKVLALSFNDLPYYLKACFLYLSLFPALRSVETMRLIRLWIAEGFVAERKGKSLEEVADGYFKELLDRGLVQVSETTSDGRIKSCKMHDLLREIAISKAKEQDIAEFVRDQHVNWSDKVRRLSVSSTLQNGNNKRVSKLRALLVFLEDEEEENRMPMFSLSALFPRRFRLLKVLDLRGLPLNSFPSEIEKLYHLKYLSLRETAVKYIPSWIKKLQNLETLDLKQTKVSELPLEILSLRNLRHLLVYRYDIQSYVHFDSKYGVKAPKGIGNNLLSLQKLCFVEAGQGNEAIVLELGQMSQLRRLGIIKLREKDSMALCSSIEKLTKLRSLSLTSVDKENIIDLRYISHAPESLNRMYLAGRLDEMPHWINSLRNLVILFLKWSRLKEDPLVHLRNLPNLVHLEFLQVYDGESLHFEEGGFQKLKLLGLDKLDQLKSMTIDRGVMPHLEKLVIQRCMAMKNVPVGIEHLTNLKAIEFFGMPDELVMKLRPDGGEDYWKVVNVPVVYSLYWVNNGWDVYSIERFSEKDNIANPERMNRPSTLWKL